MYLFSDGGWVPNAKIGRLPVHVLLVRRGGTVTQRGLVQPFEILVLVRDSVPDGVVPDRGN